MHKFNINWFDYHKHLDYKETFFKDDVFLKLWQEAGLKNQTKIFLHQITKPYFWMNNLVCEIEQYFKLSNITYAFHKIIPGNFLPTHTDKYGIYKEKNHLETSSQIKRIIIFLEDACDGHLLVVNNKCFINWKKGEWVSWIGEDKHLAANLGVHNRYTLQVTGTIK